MLALGDNATLKTNSVVSDDKWHLIQYQRQKWKASLIIDRKEEVESETKNHVYFKMDYYERLYIGQRPVDITFQDFIWEYNGKEVNFVNGLFDLYNDKNKDYMVIPKGTLPKFNENLPTIRSSDRPVEHKTPEECLDEEEVSCSSTPGM